MYRDLLDGMDSGGPQPQSQSFRITPVNPRVNNNPSMDYKRLLVMLAGAVLAGFAFDAVMKAGEERIELEDE